MTKRYIADEILMSEYSKWLYGKKIMLIAPTGMGKTTFILSEFLPYCMACDRKIAILCNRRLLRNQYLFDLAEKFERYGVLNRQVQIFTYQALAEQIKQGKCIEQILREFDVVVCDEAHYFYADSDFNAYETYVLLQELVRICIGKCMIFITATPEEVMPLIEHTLEMCGRILNNVSDEQNILKIYDYSKFADYSRFKCYFLEDVQSLCRKIGESGAKTIIFVDDKSRAESLKNMLQTEGKIKAQEIFILNAEIMDENAKDSVIRKLAIRHTVVPRVLLTTSVLDNGVSIHDSEVGNIVIATDSKLSFLQMLGRVRSESSESCCLYIYPRGAGYYEKRIEQAKKKIDKIEEFSHGIKGQKGSLLMQLWDEKDNFGRNIVVLADEETVYYSQEKSGYRILGNDYAVTINEFAKEKMGNSYLTYLKFLRLAMGTPEEVAKAQIAWIGKTPDDLIVLQSTYREERVQELQQRLLAIKNVPKEELQEIKSKLARDFREDLIGDIVTKNQSFSKEKLIEICKRYNLKLIEDNDLDGKKMYTVVDKENV